MPPVIKVHLSLELMTSANDVYRRFLRRQLLSTGFEWERNTGWESSCMVMLPKEVSMKIIERKQRTAG
ncbi:hypothetical protein TNCT_29231 [Trichonephila clavata]|uniref:Uncharacterized protein n=1 Tax=Trichonephila clavata TaxID=2740835 RepID=A0A8X6F6F6_TRICU|nr:hypothetical protein TNCT_29231 [Trichonephila clavata]